MLVMMMITSKRILLASILTIKKCWFLGWDSTCTWSDATPSNAPAGEEGSNSRTFTRPGQCKDCGPDISSWSDDRSYNGRRFAIGGHSAADSCDEHAHWCSNCKQHHVYIPLLACFLHQSLPAGDKGIHRRLDELYTAFPVLLSLKWL